MTPPADLHVTDHPGTGGGAAPLVVIVHGAMDRSASFGRVTRQLGDLHVVRYDRRGYGRSAGLEPGTLADHVDDLLRVIDGRPATVFGHSIGGVIALRAAQLAPGLVRSVLAYEAPLPWVAWWPSPRVDDGAGDPAEAAEAFMRRAIGDHFWQRLPARTRADRRAEGEALQADIASLRGAAPFDVAAVTCPVVVAAGADTTWWHTRAAQELAASLPEGELQLVAGAEHGVHLTHPTATADLVRQAVARGRADHRR